MPRVLQEQLTEAQEKYLYEKILSLKFDYTFHAAERMAEKNITEAEVIDTINVGTLLEFSNAGGNRCVLVREGMMCVTLDLDHSKIITVWRNALASDQGRDLSQYNLAAKDTDVGCA